MKYLSIKFEAKTGDIANEIGLKHSRTRDYLSKMIEEELIVAEGGNRNRTYRLKK